jgi:hypothetical protein
MPGRRDVGPAGAALVLMLVLSCSVLETREAHYPTLAAAVADGAVARGWVPDLLPPDASDIREIHDLDTEEVWSRFTCASESLAGVLRTCSEVDALHVAWPRATRRLSWWPQDLQQAASRPGQSYRFFRCPAPDRYPGQSHTMPTFLAFAEGQRSAWYWRRP